MYRQELLDVLNGTIDLSTYSGERLEGFWAGLQNEHKLLLLLFETLGGVASAVEASIVPGDQAAVITSGTSNTIPSGSYSALVVKTNAGDSTAVGGQTLTSIKDTFYIEAPPGKFLPAITITPAGASTHAWTAVT